MAHYLADPDSLHSFVVFTQASVLPSFWLNIGGSCLKKKKGSMDCKLQCW